MELINLPTRTAEGSYLAHAQNGMLSGKLVRIKKGTLLDAQALAALLANGHDSLTVARFEQGDIHEDLAADRLAQAICGTNIRVDEPFTGRANLFSTKAGLFVPNADLVHQINKVDPSITIATLPNLTPIEKGRMVATVKIIPFAVPGISLDTCLKSADKKAIAVVPYASARVGLIATTLPTLKASVMDKTKGVLTDRLAASGSTLLDEIRVPHDVQPVSHAIRELAVSRPDVIILFGASAMIDAGDVLPSALREAGGEVSYVGMPVDPGNLLFLGNIDEIPVIGAPGCARSPVENGFDWVLNRILAGQKVLAADIAAMGVGGLLMEIVSRPQPRELAPAQSGETAQVAAIVLAAGQSKRMGPNNKLIAELDGKALIRHVAGSAKESLAKDVIVVTGAEPEKILDAIPEFEGSIVHNPDFDQGLSTSLRVGIRALEKTKLQPDAAIVLLGDMPRISKNIIDQLITAFDPSKQREIIVPTDKGKRGNPVLWSARFLDKLMDVKGDTGGRHLIGEFSEFVHEVEIGAAASFDLDTPEALQNAGGHLVD